MCPTSDRGVHLLIMPFPASGHIIPLLDLTHLLIDRGLTVTVVVSPVHRPLLDPILAAHPATSVQPLVLSYESPSPDRGVPAIMRATAQISDPIIGWWRSHPWPPVAIVSDFFLGWTHHLATQLGVPRVAFWASGTFTASIFTSMWRNLPKNDDPANENFLLSLKEIPNSPSYPWWQITQLYRDFKEGDRDCEFLRDSLLANSLSWGVVFNSFTELERVYIDHMKKVVGHGRVWAVGPLLPPEDDEGGSTNRGGSSSVTAHEVMTWLDGKDDDSVVYVCFGSRLALTGQQMEVLATALECSGVHFILCAGATNEGRVAIPDGFEDRVGNKGLVVKGWVPQVAILRHRAVGAFVTHCGWNSVLEGLAAGVLMLTWPLGADQFTDAKLLVDQHGAAVRACEGGYKNVPDLSELIRLLAESIGGRRPERTRARQLHESAWAAVKGGSSTRDLEELVEQLDCLNKKEK
ncbi:hypothetical protein U1Q18_027714 [Sarracenia purpurea var. burkii]